VGRLGTWHAGRQRALDSDVMMLVGANPILSLCTAGFVMQDATRQMKAAKAPGLKLIVVDPRRTESAHYADIFLQVRPGEDPTLSAGLWRMVLAEGWEDRAFCARWVNGLDALRRAVEPFTPDYVERRAGVPQASLRAAAAMFARDSR